MDTINITLTNGVQMPVTLPAGTEAGHIRTLRRELDEIGAPSTFSIAVNGVGVEDNAILEDGAQISFRPITGTKG